MRISEGKLPPAVDLGRAVPNGVICKPRAKGELRDPGDDIKRQVSERLMSLKRWDTNHDGATVAQVVDAVSPWWRLNQDSTFAEVLADLIAPRSPEPEIDRLRLELRESRAEVSRLRDALKSSEAEADGMRRKLEKVSFLIKDDEERSR
jgi:hypothetical protein